MMKKKVTNCNGPEKVKIMDTTDQQVLNIKDKKIEYIEYLENMLNKAFKFEEWYELTTGESLENQQHTDVSKARGWLLSHLRFLREKE